MTSELKAVELAIAGRVQGVAFRHHTRKEAERLGVCGHVRNESDGTVSVYAEGPSLAVDAFIEWCREGPTLARVDSVQERPAQPRGLTSFEVTR